MATRVFGISAAWLALFLAVAGMPAHAQQETKRFVHPDGLFTLTLPADVDIRSGDGPVAVKAVSRNGWILTVQTGAANREIDFRGMISRLEDRYLGENLAWNKKVSERTARIGGLPALELIYDAARTRWQTIIARGQHTDFVIFVSAPPEVFADRGGEIHAILASFGTRPDEVPADRPSKVEAIPPGGSLASLAQVFSDPLLGYSIGYPADWIVSQNGEFSALFSGREGTDAYFATITTQNVSPPGVAGPAVAAEIAFDEHRARLAADSTSLTYAEEKPFAYDRGGVRLLGQEFLAHYAWNGQRFAAWVVVLPNPVQPVAHIFSYAAPEERFSTYRPIADAMLRSWSISGTEEVGAKR
ncbi:MAG: hypothetical protein O3A84_01500 [Proteobacteria bacterium]|nr:hypothetical protein [Pseudomonadota bacterium]